MEQTDRETDNSHQCPHPLGWGHKKDTYKPSVFSQEINPINTYYRQMNRNGFEPQSYHCQASTVITRLVIIMTKV